MKTKELKGVLLYILSGVLFLSFLGNTINIIEWETDRSLHTEDVGSLIISNLLIVGASIVCFIGARKSIKKTKEGV